MNNYKPLDISSYYNATISDVEALSDLPHISMLKNIRESLLSDNPDENEFAVFGIGDFQFRGIPFHIGNHVRSKNDPAVLVIDKSINELKIPVNTNLHTITFAHRLTVTQLLEGQRPGMVIAEYIFHMKNGDKFLVPIREKFEISVVADDDNRFAVGYQPYNAFTDHGPTLHPRHKGFWHLAGRRQTEGEPAFSCWYLLWYWTNPNPDNEVDYISIIPKGEKFVIGGITLGFEDEIPFSRDGRKPVVIEVDDKNLLKEETDLRVEVDRGISTYVHPLSSDSKVDFLKNKMKGWGQFLGMPSKRLYTQIAAIPSATLKIFADKDEVASMKWADLEKERELTNGKITTRLIEDGKNWVHVTVVDEDTNQPVPCRVHFRSPEGVPYQPHGHHNHVNSNLDTWHIDVGGDLKLGQITYAYINGKCEGWLPRGEVIVDVARGFEYEPLRTTVKISPGQQELRLSLKRWISMKNRGWYSGDSHVHFLSTQGAHLESKGEDLDVVNLLQAQWGSLFTNTEDFVGEPSVSRDGENIVYVSQENRQHKLGHMILWGLKNPVMPWSSDGLSEAEIAGAMETTLSHWADHAHNQGGYVISPHFPFPNGEVAALVATNRLDAVEMIRQRKFSHLEYYKYLNCGYRLPLVGGTDKMSSDVPVGLYRTYVRFSEGQEFSYANWCRNVALGRTFLSGGPIIDFRVEGYEPGDTFLMNGPGNVNVTVRAESTIPIYNLEIIQEGKVIMAEESPNGQRVLEINLDVNISSNKWLSARCGGPGYFSDIAEVNSKLSESELNKYAQSRYLDVWNRAVFAHTSPVYVACGTKEWNMYDPSIAEYMQTLIEGGLTYIDNISTQDSPGNTTHHHGEDDHMEFLKRPFNQALESLRDRMHRAK